MWLAGLHARPWPAASTLSGGGGEEIDRRLARVTTGPWSASFSLSLSTVDFLCVWREGERERETGGGGHCRGKGVGIVKGSGCKPTKPQHTYAHTRTHTPFSLLTQPLREGGGGGGGATTAAVLHSIHMHSGPACSFPSRAHSLGSAAKRWQPRRCNLGLVTGSVHTSVRVSTMWGIWAWVPILDNDVLLHTCQVLYAVETLTQIWLLSRCQISCRTCDLLISSNKLPLYL